MMIKSMRVVFHGMEHTQFFQGHGVSFTKYTHCATGIGESQIEALRDAEEMIWPDCEAKSGPNGETFDAMLLAALHDEGVSMVGLEAREEHDRARLHDGCTPDEEQHEGCELYYHVSIDVEIG